MFHHFHDDKVHNKGQGSISKDKFYEIIKYIGKDKILNAEDFFENFKKNKLKENHVCITFDDAVKSQIDVALPVLEDLKIKSFFFVYTSIFENEPDLLEIYRYFRINFFKNVNEFYDSFFKNLNLDINQIFKDEKNNILKFNEKYPFYSLNDIKFRFIRDKYLKAQDYKIIMINLMKEKNFEYEKNYNKLFFNEKDIIKLDSLGHTIGLHTHNHPTALHKLKYKDQENEYSKCISMISNILQKNKSTIKTVSHPLGNYNYETLEILKNLGIELGFKDTMNIDRNMKKINNSSLEIARQDHSLILKDLN